MYISDEDKVLLEQYGWEVECQSPLEIRHPETGSFATQWSVYPIICHIKENPEDWEEFLVKEKVVLDPKILLLIMACFRIAKGGWNQSADYDEFLKQALIEWRKINDG